MLHEAAAQHFPQAPLGARTPARALLLARPRAKCLDGLASRSANARAGGRDRPHDRRLPGLLRPLLQRQHRLDRRRRAIGALAIGLVHDEDVRNLHDAGLERLHLVAGAGHQRDDGDVRRANDVHLVLTDADRFDDDDVVARGVEDDRGFRGGARQAAEMTARGHAADEHAGVLGVRLHADAIAENRAAAVRTRRIDRDDADRAVGLSKLGDQPIDERALARAGRTRDADEIRASGPGEQAADETRQRRAPRPRSGKSPARSRGDRGQECVSASDELGARRYRPSSCRPITSRWISLVPSPMVQSLTSRKYFSAG